jgi:hypothetical protein
MAFGGVMGSTFAGIRGVAGKDVGHQFLRSQEAVGTIVGDEVCRPIWRGAVNAALP